MNFKKVQRFKGSRVQGLEEKKLILALS